MRNFTLVLVLVLSVFFINNTNSVSQTVNQQDTPMLPPNAKPGECYAKVQVPATFETYTEEIVKVEGSEKIEVSEPQFNEVEEKVLVKEASYKLEVVPAQYEEVEEKVLVEPAHTVLEVVPAKYEVVEEKVLVKPATNLWKEGRGPIERVDNSTGEIMCLVEEPAKYKTIEKKVLKTPAKVVKKDIPAKYKTVKKTVMKTPPTTKKVEIPAEYTTVKVKKMVTPAREKRNTVPQQTQTITKIRKVSEGKLEWKQVLCETNMTEEVVKQIQRSLKDAGYYKGTVDGLMGSGTVSGIRAYQKEKGLAEGGITLETLKQLGVNM